MESPLALKVKKLCNNLLAARKTKVKRMPDCEQLKNCPFFHNNMKNMPAITEMLKMRFCRGDNSKCARYMVLKKLGKHAVPANLIPNQLEKAKTIISNARTSG